MTTRRAILGDLGALSLLGLTGCGGSGSGHTLRNVSYDPTRKLYEEINHRFVAEWEKKGHGEWNVEQSHGGSGKQARAVMDGLDADVVTLGLALDIDAIASRAKLVATDWQKRLPYNSCPSTSTIVFLVRRGNPKGVRDWDDLTRPGVAVITPNPKTSGGARWNHLAAWGYAMESTGKNEAASTQFLRQLYKNVPVLDSGARGATTTFVQRRLGDVLITWENEAYLARREFAEDGLEVVTPALSIRAEPPVALVDVVAQRRKTVEAATAYLEFLYTKESQHLMGQHGFRPSDPEVLAVEFASLPTPRMLTIDEDFGGWPAAQAKHFAEGAIFDQIYEPGS